MADRRIIGVQLIEVDVVGAKAPQRFVDGVEDVAAARPALEGKRPHRADALRGDHEVVTAAFGQPAADDLLARTAGVGADRIHVGGVEERDAHISCRIHDGEARRFVTLEAERHRAEAEPGDLQAGPAQSNMIHARTVAVVQRPTRANRASQPVSGEEIGSPASRFLTRNGTRRRLGVALLMGVTAAWPAHRGS